MLYQVPQFIEVEDKILGPLSMRQLFIVAGLGFVLFALYFIFTLWLFIIIAVIAGVLTATLLFGKIQGRPIVSVIGSILRYYLNPRLYLWERKLGVTKEALWDTRGKLQDTSAELDIGRTPE